MDSNPQGLDQLSPVKRAIVELRELRAKLKEAEGVRNEPIAIIGMGCRFPGGANDAQSLWQMLVDGVDAIREIPADRWDIDEFFDADPDAPGKMSTRWAGFLDEVDKFDADFFGISPREAVGMDPQQRLLLEVSWEALENAAQAPEKLLGSSTGVFIGIASNDYAQLLMQFGDPTQIDAYLATGTCHSVASGRISYTLGLQGPSISLDTACSSSLVAVHLACQSLRIGECRMALAGGVNIILAPELLVNFSKSHMMAADGRCKTFDASADGFVRGEGCGVVVLKRLSDAISARDNVLGVIRGTAINQDGRSSGLTVPNGTSQQDVIRRALANAGVLPSEVGYVETHGTGTSLGDPIEVHALHDVYGEGRSKRDPLALGSLKTNIGHLETAAGVASLLKTVLILLHGEIPPHLHLTKPNPHIAWNEYGISVPTSRTPWPSDHVRRIAAVSSFGFSGTNSHVVIEGAHGVQELISSTSQNQGANSAHTSRTIDGNSAHKEVESLEDRSHHLLTLSAKTDTALEELVGRYGRYLSGHPESVLSDMCHTANVGRSHFEHRLATVAASVEQLRQNLNACARGEDPVGLIRRQTDLTRRPEIVFLFTGQGGQYVNMGRRLYESEPIFREVLDRCDELLRTSLDQPLLSVLYPATGDAAPLDETQYTHVAMFAVQYALAQLWRSWGVEPAVVMGHSVGEIPAATVAGSMSFEDGLMLMWERGRLMQSLPTTGMMASLLAGEELALEAIDPYRERVAIAALNGPESTVISGEREAVQEILRKLDAQGIKAKPLKVSNSFHSPLVEPVLDEFESAAARINYRAPHIGQFSSMRLQWVGEQNLLDAPYWRHNLRHTVRFSQAMAMLYGQGHRIFLEIGPSPILVSMGSQCVPLGEGTWLPSLRPDRNDWEQVLEDIATLYVNGVNIDWKEYDRYHARKKVMLPTYPWQRKPFLAEAAKTRRRGFRSHEASRWQGAVNAAQTQSQQVPIDLALDRYPAKWEALDQLTMFWIQRVLFELGAFRKPNQTYTLDSLIDTLNIQPGYRIPVSHWLRKLLSDGLVEQAGDSYFSKTAWCDQAPDLANKGAELSDVSFIVEYISRCGEMAPAILRGEASSLDTLFPGGSLQLAEHIYEHWALSRYFSGILRSALESVVRTLPHGRQLRIVEIGAGTGGSTSALLPLLPPTRTLYCFTDRSTFFLDRARQKYQAYPFLRFELLDIEKNTTEQGFGEHEFDVVVASNVLHATRNLGQTIENVSKLLGPGGLLLLCEVTRPRTWIEFTYGLIEGWSIFDDGWRQDGPLLSQDRWEGLLRKHGFEDVAVFPELGSSAEILGEHCIIALAPAGAHASRHDKPEARISELTERSEADHDQATGSGRPPKDDFVNSLRLSLPGQRREQLVEFVRNHTMRVLRRNSSEPIDSRRRLMDLGIDSLMAVELRNTLSTDLGLLQTLPATLIFDYPNVEAIADFLTRTLNLDRNETDMDSRIDQQLFGNTAESQTAKLSVENLSDEEVEQLLLKRLGAS